MDRLKREANPPVSQLASPIPQYKTPGAIGYEAVEGQHGAPFATLKDASGNVVSPATEAKLEQVRELLSGVATENKLEQARTLLDAINTKDFATQTTLAATLTKLGQLETELATIKANQLSGDQKVTLSGNNVEHITLVNAVAHTMAGFFAVPLPNLTKYRDIDFIITNTTDKGVLVWVKPFSFDPSVTMEDGTIKTYGGSTGYVSHLVPSGSRDLYLSNVHPKTGDLKTLNRAPFKDYLTASGVLTYRFTTAPTSGALTIGLQGVLR